METVNRPVNMLVEYEVTYDQEAIKRGDPAGAKAIQKATGRIRTDAGWVTLCPGCTGKIS